MQLDDYPIRLYLSYDMNRFIQRIHTNITKQLNRCDIMGFSHWIWQWAFADLESAHFSKWLFGGAVTCRKGTTVTSVLPSAIDLRLSLPVRLNSTSVGAFVTLPLLLTMLFAKGLLDRSQASYRAPDGSCCTHVDSGHTYTFFLTSLFVLCLSFHGRLRPLLCSCRFWSVWNPLSDLTHKPVGC